MNSILGSEDVQAEMTDDTTYKQLPDSSLVFFFNHSHIYFLFTYAHFIFGS